MRKNGMLMPVFALPSEYGIGCFSKAAYEFADLLAEAGQSLWQILPLGPTGYGDSPYQSFSTFAGNPYFIDLEQLMKAGLLSAAECEPLRTPESSPIDYQSLYQTRFELLKKAYQRSDIHTDPGYQAFCREQAGWLEDYALFMAVKAEYGEGTWHQWEPGIRFRDSEAVLAYRRRLAEEIDYYKYLQYLFGQQWLELKAYANGKGIEIIGDIPIYVAADSADVWAHPELFRLDDDYLPTAVAGCPPDSFSASGQLWGNPLYDWPVHQEQDYEWWIRRIAHCFSWYDIVRIDHFRGFDEYYSVPYQAATARNGTWCKGPGMDLFAAVRQALGPLRIIAEDLGFLTDSVIQLLRESGYPGMKVLQFAFDSREESDYLPHNYHSNCVVYTGTHDNDTLKGWYQNLKEEDRLMACLYTNSNPGDEEELHRALICLAMGSVADNCIIPVQDYLGIGSEGRINTPSTLGGNWQWRMPRDAFTGERIRQIKRMTELYGRRGRGEII